MVHWARLRTISPWSVTRWRSLRRVAISSPTNSRHPPCSTQRPSGSSSPACRRLLLAALVEPVHESRWWGRGGRRSHRPGGETTTPLTAARSIASGVPPCSRPWARGTVSVMSGSPARSRRVASRSHGWWKRWTRSSSIGVVGVDQEAEHAAPPDGGELLRVADQHHPPAPDVGQVGQLGQTVRWAPCRPRPRARWRRRAGRSGDRADGSGGARSRSLSTVSAATPVSTVRTSAAVAEGATPNTARPSARSCSTAGVRAVVLPVPAGPTISTRSSQPATAAAASACTGFNTVRRAGGRAGMAVTACASSDGRPRPAGRLPGPGWLGW